MIAGGAAAAGIATTAGAAVLGSLFGVAGAGLAGYKMKRRVGAIEEFAVETLSNGRNLHVAVAVSGWIADEREDNFRWPWRHLACSTEQFCLRYESNYLLQLGQSFEYLMSFAVSYAIQQTLMETALAGSIAFDLAQTESVGMNLKYKIFRISFCTGLAFEHSYCRQRGRQPLERVLPTSHRSWSSFITTSIIPATRQQTGYIDWIQSGRQSYLSLFNGNVPR